MKILTKEEEDAHYNATVKGGFLGGTAGLVIGGAAVFGAHHRFPTFRSLTLPMKAFLVSSSATFAAIIYADRASRRFEEARDPARKYRDRASQELKEKRAHETTYQRSTAWLRQNRFSLVGGGWAVSMLGSFYYINRDRYLTGAQKLVQARVVAQGITIALIVATAALEIGDARKGEGRYETVMVVDPNDPEHRHLIEKRIHKETYEGEDLWRDMVDAEEKRIAARREAVDAREAENPTAKHRHASSSSSSSSSSSASSQPTITTTKGKMTRDPRDAGPGPSTKQGTGKKNKDKILEESRRPSNQSEAEIEEKEKAKMEAQKQKQSDAHRHAVPSAPADSKVSDRGEV